MNKPSLLIDSSFFYALYAPRDKNYLLAREFALKDSYIPLIAEVATFDRRDFNIYRRPDKSPLRLLS